MSDQTVGAAVERVTAAHAMIEHHSDQFAALLPAHVGERKFARWALTCLRDPKLCQPVKTSTGREYPAVLDTDAGSMSVIAALMDCAALGLEPGRTYHLAPYAGTVTGIVDYKGEIQLITNANPRASVVAMTVHASDDFAMTGANIPPRHDADWFGDRGALIGGYSYVEQAPGQFSLVVRMSEAEFLKHRDKARSKNVWDEWGDSMRLKTLIHQQRKWVPWSAERISQ